MVVSTYFLFANEAAVEAKIDWQKVKTKNSLFEEREAPKTLEDIGLRMKDTQFFGYLDKKDEELFEEINYIVNENFKLQERHRIYRSRSSYPRLYFTVDYETIRFLEFNHTVLTGVIAINDDMVENYIKSHRKCKSRNTGNSPKGECDFDKELSNEEYDDEHCKLHDEYLISLIRNFEAERQARESEDRWNKTSSFYNDVKDSCLLSGRDLRLDADYKFAGWTVSMLWYYVAQRNLIREGLQYSMGLRRAF